MNFIFNFICLQNTIILGFQAILFVHCVCMSEQYVNDVSIVEIYLTLSCKKIYLTLSCKKSAFLVSCSIKTRFSICYKKSY